MELFETVQCGKIANENDTSWHDENRALLADDYSNLADLNITDRFCDDEINGLFDVENTLLVYQAVSEENSIASAAEAIMEPDDSRVTWTVSARTVNMDLKLRHGKGL